MTALQNATLVLRTMDLTQSASTVLGTADNIKCNLTWNNINLRTVLGDMYDKYDMFCLKLCEISTCASATTFGTATNDRYLLIRMSGLPWINQTYSQLEGCNTLPIILTTYNIGSSASITNKEVQSGKQFIFGKNQDVCNISLNCSRFSDDTTPQTSNPLPDSIFQFEIYGVDKNNKINGTRMI